VARHNSSAKSHDDPYRDLRTVLTPALADLPEEEIVEILAPLGIDVQELAEGWNDLLNTVAKGAQQIVPQILPGAVQGAATGAPLGPYGALVGGVLGAAQGLQAQSSPKPQGQPVPQPTSSTQIGPVPGQPITSPSAQTLLGLLSNPTVWQALMATVLGPQLSRNEVAVKSGPVPTSVPVSAVVKAVGEVARQAAEEYDTATWDSEGVPPYLQDPTTGRLLVEDLADSHQRSLALAEFLSDTEQYEAYQGERSREEYREDLFIGDADDGEFIELEEEYLY
jgi:hypothetical protein